MRWVDKLLAGTGLLQCPACEEPTPTPGLCGSCAASLPANRSFCTRCSLPLPKPAICLECQQRPPAWTHCHAPWRYESPLQIWLHRAKFHEDLVALQLLCELARPPSFSYSQLDAVCPVSMPPARLRRRGMNLAAELARAVARYNRLPLWQALHSVEQPRQSLQNRAQRLRRHDKHFRTTRPVDGRRILLVDDVMTTGATLRAASTALLRGGAAEVQVMALLRTPHRRTQSKP